MKAIKWTVFLMLGMILSTSYAFGLGMLEAKIHGRVIDWQQIAELIV